MKKFRALLSLSLVAAVLCFSSFTPTKQQHKNAALIRNYAWYTPSGQFIAWSTLVNAEFVSGDDTNPVGGTLDSEGYTGGGPGVPPVGAPVYLLYHH
jgi:hypothetical protein